MKNILSNNSKENLMSRKTDKNRIKVKDYFK